MRATLFVLILFLFPLIYIASTVVLYEPKESGGLINPPYKVAKAAAFNESVAVANRYWASKGVPSPCSKITGRVVARIPNWQGIDADGGAREGACEILMRRGWYQAAATQPQRFCALVLHEVGHIGGQEHSRNPQSVMFTPQLFVPDACRVLVAYR